MQRALLVLLVAASYLLFAGAPRWAAIPLLLLASGAALAAPRRTLAFPRAYRPLDWSLAALALGLVLQLIPLPGTVVAMLSPRASTVRSALGFSAWLEKPAAWTPLSIAANATVEALGTLILAILTFWVARAVFSTPRGTRSACQSLAVMGGAAAVLGIAQRALAPHLVLGLLPADTPAASPFGAFVNRNHFAAWLLMIAAPVGGYLIAHVNVHSAYQRGWRAALCEALRTGSLLTVTAVMICIGALLLTLSRSALAGLGAAAVWGWLFARSRVEVGRQALPVLFAVMGAVVLVVVLFVDIDGWAARINSSFEQTQGAGGRVTIWRETLPIIRDFPVTGTGAGTYSDAMTVYQQSRIWVGSMQKWTHFNNAHSHYVQLAAEGGVLLVLPVAAGLWWLTVLGRRAIAGDRGQIFWVRAGAAAGLVGVAVQSVWEVPLVMPANAVLAAVLAALVVHERHDGVTGPTGPQTSIENH